MGRITVLGAFLAVICWLSGCATGEPRLQGTWQSHKVAMPVEKVKVTKMETVKVRKGHHKITKHVPRTVTIAKTKSAPPYIDLIVTYRGARLTMEFPPANGGTPIRRSFPYEVAASDANSVVILVRDPATGEKSRILMTFDGPNRYWVNPADGVGWKEYYERISQPK